VFALTGIFYSLFFTPSSFHAQTKGDRERDEPRARRRGEPHPFLFSPKGGEECIVSIVRDSPLPPPSLPPSLPLSLLPLSHTHTASLSHTHRHSFFLSLARFHSRSLCRFLFLLFVRSFSHTHYLSLNLSTRFSRKPRVLESVFSGEIPQNSELCLRI